MEFNGHRFDARFWGPTLVGVLLAGTFGCFGMAAAAHSTSPDATGIVSVSDALRQMDETRGGKIRRGVMTERIRNEVIPERVAPETLAVGEAR